MAQVVIKERVEVQPSAAEKQARVQALQTDPCDLPENNALYHHICKAAFDILVLEGEGFMLYGDSTYLVVDTVRTNHIIEGYPLGTTSLQTTIDRVSFYVVANPEERGHVFYNGSISDVLDVSLQTARSGEVGFVADGVSPFVKTGDPKEPGLAGVDAAIYFDVEYSTDPVINPDDPGPFTISCAQCTSRF